MKRAISLIVGAGVLSVVATTPQEPKEVMQGEVRDVIREGIRAKSKDGKGQERREHSRNKHLSEFRNAYDNRYDADTHYHDWSENKHQENNHDNAHLEWDHHDGKHYESHAQKDNNKHQGQQQQCEENHRHHNKHHGKPHRHHTVTKEVDASKSVNATRSQASEVQASESVEASRRNLRNSAKSGSINKSHNEQSEIDREIDISASDVTRGNENSANHAHHGEQRGELDLVQEGAKEGGILFHEAHQNNNGTKDGEITCEEVEVKEDNKSIKHRHHGEKHDRKKWMKTKSNKKVFNESYGNGKKAKCVKGKGKHMDKMDMKRSHGGRQADLNKNHQSSFVKVNRKHMETDEELSKNHADTFNAAQNENHSRLNENDFAANRNMTIAAEKSAHVSENKQMKATEVKSN